MVDNLYNLGDLKGHRIVAWNSRSLLNKIEEIDRIATISKAHFLGILESWLSPKIDNSEINLSGYQIVRFDRTAASGKIRGGGLVWYVHNDINYTPMYAFNICSPNIECLWICLHLTHTRPIYMGLVYRPPDAPVPLFLNELEGNLLEILSKGQSEINIFTDSNIDSSKPRNPDNKRYNDFLKRFGLSNMIKGVTHIKNGGLGFSAIDHVLTTNPHIFQTCGTIPSNASDHFPIYGVRKKPYANHPKVPIKSRAYSKINNNNFINDIESQDWSSVLVENPDTAWSNFKEIFLNTLHKHAPEKTYQSRRDTQPWVCNEFYESANERDDRQHKAKNTKSPIDQLLANQARNRTTALKRELKRMFFQKSIEEAQGDSGKLWKTLKRLMQNSSDKYKINSIDDHTDPIDIVNCLNDYFVEIGPKLADNMVDSNLVLEHDIPDIPQMELE